MRPFWQNGLFVSLVIFAGYFLLSSIERKKWFDFLLFGLFLGLALTVRTSEVIWLATSIILILVINHKKLKYKYLLFSLVGFLIFIIPLLYYQADTYGNVLVTGYTANSVSSSSNQETGNLVNFMEKILPFGFQPKLFFKTFFNYSFRLMFPWFTLAFIGVIIFFKKYYHQKENQGIYIYSLWFLGLSLWLMIYYGSFEFYEYLDKSAVLIGISYARYWLPLYIFCLPLTVLLLEYFSSLSFSNRKYFIRNILFVVLITISLFQIILDPYYGLKVFKNKYTVQANDSLSFVLNNTPEDAIIIAGTSDKTYWSDRRVIGYNGDRVPDQVLRNLPTLFNDAPIYYEEILVGEVSRLNSHLKDNGLLFNRISQGHNIYKLTVLSE
jgi:hypothetical protein